MVQNLLVNAGDTGDAGSIPELERSPEKDTVTLLSFLAWESHGQRSLLGYRSRGHKELVD